MNAIEIFLMLFIVVISILVLQCIVSFIYVCLEKLLDKKEESFFELWKDNIYHMWTDTGAD